MALPSLGRLPLTETGAKKEEDESGLTRSLKNASLVPTGACLPRGFDPNYCDMDPFYFAGVAIVSSVVGLLASTTSTQFVNEMSWNLRRRLGQLCYTPPSTSSMIWDLFFKWKRPDIDGEWDGFHWTEWQKREARAEFSAVCVALDSSLNTAEFTSETLLNLDERFADSPYHRLTKKLMLLIMVPAVHTATHPGLYEMAPTNEVVKMPGFWATLAASTVALFAALKYIKDHLQAHARMIASYFRVNAMRLRSGEEFVLDVYTFARMCREDIINTGAYDAYDPERAAAEQRLADELRQRLEKRDPLMEGLDYPETYASASGNAPLRA